jgi:hypothetical protein
MGTMTNWTCRKIAQTYRVTEACNGGPSAAVAPGNLQSHTTGQEAGAAGTFFAREATPSYSVEVDVESLTLWRGEKSLTPYRGASMFTSQCRRVVGEAGHSTEGGRRPCN